MEGKDNLVPTKYDALEMARIIGEPVDPRKPYPTIVEAVCEVDQADPNEYVYYFDVLSETDKVINISSNGEVVQENVTPDTPALLSFVDLATPEYYVKITDLASAKEATLARKLKTINRALNAIEEYKVIALLSSAASSASHEHTLSSGNTRFVFPDLVAMLDDVQDYGDNFALIAGSTVAKDIVLWDYNDNKYNSIKDMYADLNIEEIRMPPTMSLYYADDGSAGGLASVNVLDSTIAYLVARSTVNGKPGLFVRKRLNEIDFLGGTINENGERPQRLVFVSPNPITVVTGAHRYLAVGVTGYEQIATAVINYNGVSKYTRA